MTGDFFLFRGAFFNADYVQSFNELTAISNGDILLHDFSVAADNFYFTDLPFYVFGWLVLGRNPVLIFIVPYIVFLLFLAASCLLIWRAGRSPAQRLFGVAAVLVIFGIPYGWPQSVFLVSDEHGASIMMSVWALVLAQSLLRSPALKAGPLVLFCGVVFMMTASDQLTHAFFVLPFFMLFALRACVYRCITRTEFLLLGFLFCASALGTIAPWLLAGHGGFALRQSFSVQFISFVSTAIENARIVMINLAFLFNAQPAALGGGTAAVIIAGSRLLVGLVLACLCGRVVWRLPVAVADVITQWLAFGALALAAIEFVSQFFALNATCDAAGPPVCGIRFVAPVFVYLALAGILEGQVFLSGLASSRLKNILAGGFAIATVLFFGGGAGRFIDAARQPEFAQNLAQVALADWLAARNLTYGVSDYWTAPLITAFSGGKVKTDAVIVTTGIQPGNWIGNMADLRAGRRPEFVVFGGGDDGFQAPGTHDLDLANITAAYGTPDQVYHVGRYQLALLRKPDQ